MQYLSEIVFYVGGRKGPEAEVGATSKPGNLNSSPDFQAALLTG